MVATVAWDGYGRVTAGDSTTSWTALKISGTGGGPSAAVADGQKEGTGAVTCTVNKQRVALYFDIGSGNELDFSGGGAEEGQLVYMWSNFLAASLLNNRSAGGFGMFLESSTPSTTQHHLYYFEGADTYSGGWKRFILDPNETVSASAGTAINLASVRYFGVFADVGGTTARFDNLICDAIDVGNGLIVTGTSTTDDLVGDLLANEASNFYGIATPLNTSATASELAGTITVGDDTGTAATTVTDVDKKLFVAEPLYYDGTSVTNSVPLDYAAINIVGNGTGATSVTLGKKVGTGDDARGRNGISVIGNDTYNVSIDFDDGNVNTCLIYGCTFENLSGTLTWGTNTAHECIGNAFNGCEQFDPVGGIIIRNGTWTGYAGTDAALLWNASIDIKNSNFIANTDGTNSPAGIEHTVTGTPNYDNLQFSGNDADVYLSATSGTLTVSKTNGSNPATKREDGTSSVVFTGSVNVLVTAVNDILAAIEGAAVYLETTPGGTEILNGLTNASGVFSSSYSGTTPQDVKGWVRSSSGATAYAEFPLGGSISTSGYAQTAIMAED